MIRILQMIGTLNLGGSQTMIMNVYRNIDREKIQFDFMLSHPDHLYFADEVKSLGGRIYTTPVFNGRNVFAVRRAWDEFFTAHPEYRILHIHQTSYASLYASVAKRHGVTVITHAHTTSSGPGFINRIKDTMQLPLRWQADVKMSCSTEAGIWLYGKKGIRSDNYIFLPNGVDLRRYAPDPAVREEKRAELGLNGKLVIGHVGRIDVEKNQTFLIDAFALLYEKRRNCALLLIGDGELREYAERKAAQLGLRDAVIFAGLRSDVPQLLQAMDLFAFPSLCEGLPMTLVEAQAAGLPCIVSDQISPDADITPLVKRMPIDSAARWAEELDREHEKRDVRDILAANGFDTLSSVDKLTEIYTELAGEENNGR